jgi:hypothetical protein
LLGYKAPLGVLFVYRTGALHPKRSANQDFNACA